MDYLIVVLTVYWVAVILREVFEAPRWAWYLVMAAVSCAGMWVLTPDDWWWGLGVPTIIILLSRLDELLLTAGDWLRVTVMRTTRQR